MVMDGNCLGPLKGGHWDCAVSVQCQESLCESEQDVHCGLVSSRGAAGLFSAGDTAGEVVIVGIGAGCHHPLQDPTQWPSTQGIAEGCVIHLWSQACLSQDCTMPMKPLP